MEGADKGTGEVQGGGIVESFTEVCQDVQTGGELPSCCGIYLAFDVDDYLPGSLESGLDVCSFRNVC
jgi:hypothetical protein